MKLEAMRLMPRIMMFAFWQQFLGDSETDDWQLVNQNTNFQENLSGSMPTSRAIHSMPMSTPTFHARGQSLHVQLVQSGWGLSSWAVVAIEKRASAHNKMVLAVCRILHRISGLATDLLIITKVHKPPRLALIASTPPPHRPASIPWMHRSLMKVGRHPTSPGKIGPLPRYLPSTWSIFPCLELVCQVHGQRCGSWNDHPHQRFERMDCRLLWPLRRLHRGTNYRHHRPAAGVDGLPVIQYNGEGLTVRLMFRAVQRVCSTLARDESEF